ncbi:MAG TPA: DUF2911 domain-containing protein [Bacteroidia bacterium]|jgi:tetratricopeptide (TPR) repeat protein|nr:DUF2911 domain-containing protein [Bacteroidia bacterium]
MKNSSIMHKPYTFFLVIMLLVTTGFYAQSPILKSPPNGGNKLASVSERIGITDVSIHYSRPGVKGREGKIYGTPIVHKGFIDMRNDYGASKGAPWRAGANENTTIEFSTDVKVEGKDLAAGRYGFFIAYDSSECTVIFSKNSTSWGHYFYDDKEDALRVKVKPQKLDKSVEWLRYEFMNETENSAVIALEWEKLRIPFKVETDLVKTELDDFRLELRSGYAWSWEALDQAAEFCIQNNTDLEEALGWAKNAVVGLKSFHTLHVESEILEKLNRKSEADVAMKDAVKVASMQELHLYGRELLSQKKKEQALEIFKENARRNPDQFTTYMGLARGYSANGDYKTALKNIHLALPLAPDEPNKKAVTDMSGKLEKGMDIN